MSLKKVLDIPETIVDSDNTIDGDGSEDNPLSINAQTSSPIEGNGKAGNPLKINYVDLTGSIAGSGIKANNGKLDADIHVNSPLSGKGTVASPLAIGDASGTDKGVVSLTIESEIPAQNGSDDTAITPKAVKKLVKYIKPVAASGAMSAEQQSANAIPVPFLQNFTCDGGTNGKPKFDVPNEDGTFCTIDMGALGGGGGGASGTVVWEGMSDGCISLAGKGAGLYMAVCVSTWDQQFGRDDRFVLPFVFFDIPDPIDGKNVGMTYKRDGGGNLVDRPSECVELQAKMVVPYVGYATDGNGSQVIAPITPSNMVWQIFKPAKLVTGSSSGRKSFVVKVVKLT